MDNPERGGRTLINKVTFRRNFRNKCENQTYLCYELEVKEGDDWIAVEGLHGYLRKRTHKEHSHKKSCWLVVNNCWKRGPHAELCFLDLFKSWNLDEGKQYRLTWYMSWSPYPDCSQKLVEFLGENSHVSLHIFAAGIHSLYSGYEDGLRNLRDAGAQLAIMTLQELKHCWNKFVDNRDIPFQDFPNIEEHIGTEKQKLENILESGKLKDGVNLSKQVRGLLVNEE